MLQGRREAAGELTAADEHLGVLDVVHALAELHDEGPHSHILLLKVRLQVVSRLAGLQKAMARSQSKIVRAWD